MHALSTLRPQTIGQILDRTIRLYRRNFWSFLGIVALVQVPIVALSLFNFVSTFGGMFALLQDPSALADVAVPNPLLAQTASSLVSLATLFLAQFSSAALCLAVVYAMLGESLSIADAYRKMWERWQSIAGMAVLLAIVSVALVIAMLVGALFIVIPGLIGLGVLMFVSFVVSPIVIPVLMLEQQGPWESIQRAWYLTKTRMWPLVGLMAASYLFTVALVAGVQLLVFTIFGVVVVDSFSLDNITDGFLSAAVWAVGFSTLASVFAAPIQQGVATIAYLDLRVRIEGLDLSMAVADVETPPLQLVAESPRQLNSGPLLNGSEFGRFLLLGFLPFALILLYIGLVFFIVFALVGAAVP